MRRRQVVTILGILLMIACTAAFAQNPIQNPSFENGLTNWNAYGYSSFWQVDAVPPITGGVGGGTPFNVAFPNQGPSDGAKVCGIQGWYNAAAGGVYQTFTAPGPGYIVVAARSLTVVDPGGEMDMGPRVRAGLVTGAKTDHGTVPWTGPGAWVSCAWGANWNDIVVPVAAAGTYTLFIENSITWDNCIFSTLWDNVRWVGSLVSITNQPYVSNITETSATVQWDSDVAGTSVVDFDGDGPPYASTASGTSGTHHSVTLTGLTPGTKYQFSATTAAPPAQAASSPNATFTTAPVPQAAFANGDFEAVDGSGNATLAPWQKFGKFDGLLVNNEQGTLTHGGNWMAGAMASYGTDKTLSGCLQRVTVKPNTSYVVKAWIWSEANSSYPPLPGNRLAGYDDQCRVGIDPRGGVDLWYTDPTTGQPIYDDVNQVFTDNPNIVWCPWDYSQDWQSPFTQLGYKEISAIVQTPPDSNVATIFLQVQHLWSIGMNRTVFDDVVFVEEVAVDNLAKAKTAPANWVVDLSNNGQGYVVTRYELINDMPVVWIQEDDRSAAMKVNLGSVEGGREIYPGDRITVKGRTKKYSLNGTKWGETEIAAEQFSKISSNNPAPKPVAMGNKAVAGAESGTMRGATNGVGTNNVGLLVKVVGRVKEVDPNYMPGTFVNYAIKIDDGSGVWVTVYHPDEMNIYKDMPAVGTMISAIGTSGLMIKDPTPGDYNIPNGSGDETLMPTVMLRDGNDLEIIPE